MCGRYIHKFNDEAGPKRGSFADQSRRETEAAARREAEYKRLLDLLSSGPRGFDVHIYFDAGTPSEGAAKRLAFSLMFYTERSHRIEAIGPHTKPNYDLRIHAMEPRQVKQLLQKLRAQGAGLSILVHPITGNELADHTTNAIWIGPALPLKLSALTPPKGNKPPAP